MRSHVLAIKKEFKQILARVELGQHTFTHAKLLRLYIFCACLGLLLNYVFDEEARFLMF
jgi:hypothetical protein